jgi:primosomal protein N' (replication factor Y)
VRFCVSGNDALRVAKVALDLPSYAALHALTDEGSDHLFDYRCAADAAIGQRVIVPFGRQRVIGLIAELGTSTLSEDKLKSVEAVLDDVEPLARGWFDLVRFAAHYYQRSLGEVALPALPALLRRADGYRLDKHGQLRSRSLEQLAKKLHAWTGDPEAARTSLAPNLNAEQQLAADRINSAMQSDGYSAFLLHGITGSGKTEVYLDALARVIRENRQALVLVPEINLAPPLETLLRARFGHAQVASMHSGMTDAERAVNFLAAHSGRAAILVGTRMAVLASLPKLALIVVDEEHDASFKQQEGLRYSARDLAVLRASQSGTVVVLGSATPSLESWYQAQRGRYMLLELKARATRHEALPEVHCISTRNVARDHGFTPELRNAIAARLASAEQILVFVNRRGYAPVVHCSACGWVSDCPQCTAHAVFHKSDGRLHCHHCGWQSRVPRVCPDCGNAELAPIGRGTQRVEETLREWFPDARVRRLDRDASQRKGEAQALLEAFHAGEVDILVGTQMLAKGHDFKNLTLVCVLGADSALYSADFRAPERLFANLSQVAGRAGRGDKKGVVLVQTEFTEHPLFAALKEHDFDGFAKRLLAEREDAGLPPYTYQAMLRAESGSLAKSLEFLGLARAEMQRLADDASVTIYDPVPMTLMRKANSERAQLLMESSQRSALQRLLPELIKCLRALKWRGSWHIEVDPLEL